MQMFKKCLRPCFTRGYRRLNKQSSVLIKDELINSIDICGLSSYQEKNVAENLVLKSSDEVVTKIKNSNNGKTKSKQETFDELIKIIKKYLDINQNDAEFFLYSIHLLPTMGKINIEKSSNNFRKEFCKNLEQKFIIYLNYFSKEDIFHNSSLVNLTLPKINYRFDFLLSCGFKNIKPLYIIRFHSIIFLDINQLKSIGIFEKDFDIIRYLIEQIKEMPDETKNAIYDKVLASAVNTVKSSSITLLTEDNDNDKDLPNSLSSSSLKSTKNLIPKISKTPESIIESINDFSPALNSRKIIIENENSFSPKLNIKDHQTLKLVDIKVQITNEYFCWRLSKVKNRPVSHEEITKRRLTKLTSIEQLREYEKIMPQLIGKDIPFFLKENPFVLRNPVSVMKSKLDLLKNVYGLSNEQILRRMHILNFSIKSIEDRLKYWTKIYGEQFLSHRDATRILVHHKYAKDLAETNNVPISKIVRETTRYGFPEAKRQFLNEKTELSENFTKFFETNLNYKREKILEKLKEHPYWQNLGYDDYEEIFKYFLETEKISKTQFYNGLYIIFYRNERIIETINWMKSNVNNYDEWKEHPLFLHLILYYLEKNMNSNGSGAFG